MEVFAVKDIDSNDDLSTGIEGYESITDLLMDYTITAINEIRDWRLWRIWKVNIRQSSWNHFLRNISQYIDSNDINHFKEIDDYNMIDDVIVDLWAQLVAVKGKHPQNLRRISCLLGHPKVTINLADKFASAPQYKLRMLLFSMHKKLIIPHEIKEQICEDKSNRIKMKAYKAGWMKVEQGIVWYNWYCGNEKDWRVLFKKYVLPISFLKTAQASRIRCIRYSIRQGAKMDVLMWIYNNTETLSKYVVNRFCIIDYFPVKLKRDLIFESIKHGSISIDNLVKYIENQIITLRELVKVMSDEQLNDLVSWLRGSSWATNHSPLNKCIKAFLIAQTDAFADQLIYRYNDNYIIGDEVSLEVL